jgi:hypothetical protein
VVRDDVLCFSVGFWYVLDFGRGPFDKTCLKSIDLCLDSWRRLLSTFPYPRIVGFELAENYNGLFVRGRRLCPSLLCCSELALIPLHSQCTAQ